MTNAEKLLAIELEIYIDSHGLRYFRGKEFTPYWDRSRNGVKNSPPQRALWGNIMPTLKILNSLRASAASPIYLTSTYRSPAYNAQLEGAATQSQHMRFSAIDFYSEEKTPRQLWQALKQMRDGGLFKGGLGLYKTFVHIDTRGHNADWKGQGVA